MANKFGICEWCLPERGPEAVRHAAQLGFDGIQLSDCGNLEADFPLAKVEHQEKYKKARDESGIEFHSLHLWSLCRLACMIHPVNSPAGKVAVESIRQAINACVGLGIKEIMITSGFLCQIKNKTDFDTFSLHLKVAYEMAGEYGIKIAFESALSADEIFEMKDRIGDDFKICYDTYNPIRFHMGSAPNDDICRLGEKLIDHFHLKDGPQNMVGCSLLGEGCGNFKSIVNAIKSIRYSGWFMTENYYDEFPLNRQGTFDELAKRDLETMRKYLL